MRAFIPKQFQELVGFYSLWLSPLDHKFLQAREWLPNSDGSLCIFVGSLLSSVPVHHSYPNMEEVLLTILNKTELLMVDTLEHEFSSSGNDSILLLRLAQFITCGLILVTNVPMIMFIMKQGSKTFLDWFIVIDCLL